MHRKVWLAVLGMGLVALAACNSGPVRRVSDPSASIQQLTVQANGEWELQLRLQNYSSIPMQFDQLALDLSVGGMPATKLLAAPGLSIAPESADVVNLSVKPDSQARLVIADALASRRRLDYALSGEIQATPEDAKQRRFDVSTKNTLNPVPGLDGVLR